MPGEKENDKGISNEQKISNFNNFILKVALSKLKVRNRLNISTMGAVTIASKSYKSPDSTIKNVHMHYFKKCSYALVIFSYMNTIKCHQTCCSVFIFICHLL